MFHWSQGAVYLIIVWPIRIENIGSNSLQCIDIHYGISPCIPGLVPSIYQICHHSANLCRFHMGYYSFFFCASSFTPISCRLLFLFLFFSCIVDISCSPPILIVLAVTFWLFSQPFGFSVLVLLGYSSPTVPIHLSLLFFSVRFSSSALLNSESVTRVDLSDIRFLVLSRQLWQGYIVLVMHTWQCHSDFRQYSRPILLTCQQIINNSN